MSEVILFYLPPGKGTLTPVSLGYIAANLKSQGIHADIIDLTVQRSQLDEGAIEKLIEEARPRVVGISCCNANMPSVMILANQIKKIDSNIRIIIGGVHAAFMPKLALLQMPFVDFLCRGEGEVVLPDLIHCLRQNGRFDKVNGIVFKENSNIIETAKKPITRDLDIFPSPYQEGCFRLQDYSFATMLMSRGCPYACRFCCTPQVYDRKPNLHSPKRILDDIRVCVENGVNRIFFGDTVFGYDKEKTFQLMDGIIEEGWDISIWAEARYEYIDRTLLSRLKRGGVRTLAYGLESSDETVLKAIGKHINLDKFIRTVKMTQDEGIEVEIFSVFGLPEQTYESARNTIELIKKLNVPITGNSAGQRLQLYFGSAIADNPEKFGIRVLDKNMPLFMVPYHIETRWMNAEELDKVQKIYTEEHALTNSANSKKKSQG